MRPIRAISNAARFAEGSCIFEMGETRVLCAASLSDDVPDHARDSQKGWVTAEYSMLPRSTQQRTPRARTASSGRTKEIQRLIGRSIRAAVDLSQMPEIALTLDCDVLQADGGTRTASINGAYIAMVLALRKWYKLGKLPVWPVKTQVAAVSVGIVNGKPVLDLDYVHDSKADVDMNVVMTGDGRFVEVQGSAEGNTFSSSELQMLLKLAQKGIKRVLTEQRRILGDIKP